MSRLRYHNHGGQGKGMEEAIRRESDPLVCVADTELLACGQKSKSRSVLFSSPVVWRNRVVPGHQLKAHTKDTEDTEHSGLGLLLVWELLSLQAAGTSHGPLAHLQPITSPHGQ